MRSARLGFVSAFLLFSAALLLPQGRSLTVQVTLTEGTSMAAAISPDGRTIVIDLLGRLWTLPASGGTATPITDEFADARQPTWSPDGRFIAFQSFRDGTWHLWTVQPDGTNLRQLTFGAFDHREPVFAPDSRHVAFSSDRAGNYDIWEMELSSGRISPRTTDRANDYMPSYSPDGRELAFVSERERAGVWAVGAAGTDRLLREVSGTVNSPVWTRDGTGVVFNAVSPTESRLMRDNETIVSTEDVFPFRPSWISTDELLYTADGKIKVRSLLQNRIRTIEFRASLSFDRPSYERKRRSFDSVETRAVRGIVRPVVSPDGKQVAFVALGDLWVLSTDSASGEPRRLTDDSSFEADPAWSPDGRMLAYSSDRAGTTDIWVRDLASGQEERITDSSGSESGPAWSPDSTTLAFIDGDGGITTIKAESRSVQRVRNPAFSPGRPSWSRDGRTIVTSALAPYSSRFREGTTQMVALSLDEGTERRVTVLPHRSTGMRENDGPIWSPDGTRIAMVIDGALWVIPVDHRGEPNGPARQLNREITDSPSWTGDSQSLVYLSADRLKRISASGGEPREIPLRMTWTPVQPSGRKVIRARRLFDGRTANLRTDLDIVIEGNRIRGVEPHRPDRPGVTLIDAGDLVVMPGLIEMHAHSSPSYGETMGRIWLAYGVTSTRNPASEPGYDIEGRESIDSGRRIGPRSFGTGYTFDGARIYYAGSQTADNEQALELMLHRAQVLNYDFIKTYVRLPDLLQKRVIEFAHANGMPVTSHELYPAVAFGADGVEHIRGTSRRGYSPKVSALNRTYRDVIELLGKSGMTITPTIGIMGGAFPMMAARDPGLLDDIRFRTLFPAGVVDSTVMAVNRQRASGETERLRMIQPLTQMVRDVVRAGGTVIAGTDAPIFPFGLSLHTELEHFVDGGLSPFEALQTATVHAAGALGAPDDLGTIEPGRLADLVFLDGNPLENIRNTRRVRRVMKNGELYDMERLLRR